MVEENQTKKDKKAQSNETDAKIKASKEAAVKLFNDNYIELEVTEVDERQTTHLHWPEVPVGRKATAQKEKGKRFRELLNRDYPELADAQITIRYQIIHQLPRYKMIHQLLIWHQLITHQLIIWHNTIDLLITWCQI